MVYWDVTPPLVTQNLCCILNGTETFLGDDIKGLVLIDVGIDCQGSGMCIEERISRCFLSNYVGAIVLHVLWPVNSLILSMPTHLLKGRIFSYLTVKNRQEVTFKILIFKSLR